MTDYAALLVGSVLASGNIVFKTDAVDVVGLEDRIQKALNAELGIAGGTIIRTRDELQTLLDKDPFDGLVHGRGTYLTATFLKHPATNPDGEQIESDQFTRIVGYDAAARAVLAVTDNSEPGQTPDFMGRVEQAYGKDITTRTWLTVQRIVTKMAKTKG